MSGMATPQAPGAGGGAAYPSGTLAPVPRPQTPGTMGPPQKPADRPVKEMEYDVTDSLAGTGIDIRAEEQYMTDLYFSSRFEAQEGRTGFPPGHPGSRASFYGAGPANQPPERTKATTQDELDVESAELAWQHASSLLASSRSQELHRPFLQAGNVLKRLQKVTEQHGLSLNLDFKNPQATLAKARAPGSSYEPRVNVRTAEVADGALVVTSGTWLAKDSYLADQLALLSLATRHRLRELIGDANRLAETRQKTSHGVVPEDWADAAAPVEPGAPAAEPTARAGWESAVSPRTTPLKRKNAAGEPSGIRISDADVETGTHDESLADGAASAAKPAQPTPVVMANKLAASVRDVGRKERDFEELRLRRRQMRKEAAESSTATPGGGAATAGASSGSRAGSVAPGTPGSVAPEPEAGAGGKAPTKKELKRSAAQKMAEASSHANVNRTTMQFLGSMGGFGKKKGKTYSWMAAGAAAGGSVSGTSTPRLVTSGLAGSGGPGADGGAHGGAAPAGPPALTQEGRNRLGSWREDKEKGKNIQLRDWVLVLAEDGRDRRALQLAYDRLEESGPR